MARYLNIEPMDKRKLGFGSHDASRTDEFTLDIRVRQYRELLSQEAVHNSKMVAEAAARLRGSRPTSAPVLTKAQERKRSQNAYFAQYNDRPELFQTRVPYNLYEIGKGPNVTPICNKCSRETFYCPHRVGRGEFTARRPGTANTASSVYGAFGDNTEVFKPKYGNVAETKSFYDHSHLKAGW
jgi:hypothetical protein